MLQTYYSSSFQGMLSLYAFHLRKPPENKLSKRPNLTLRFLKDIPFVISHASKECHLISLYSLLWGVFCKNQGSQFVDKRVSITLRHTCFPINPYLLLRPFSVGRCDGVKLLWVHVPRILLIWTKRLY